MFKECPMCGALVFEDMEQCFECLHVFGEEVPEIEEVSCELAGSTGGYENAMAAVLQAAEDMQREDAPKDNCIAQEMELLSGVVRLVQENAPEGALEMRMKLEGPLWDYLRASLKVSSASLCRES